MHASLVGLGDACVVNDRTYEKKERFGYLLHALMWMHAFGLLIPGEYLVQMPNNTFTKCIREIRHSLVSFEIGWAYVWCLCVCVLIRSEKG